MAEASPTLLTNIALPSIAVQATAGPSAVATITQGHPTGLRPFRSRKQRPCDACRKKKSRCAILEQGKPCVECTQTGRLCTFVEQPLERKIRDKPASPQDKQEGLALPSSTGSTHVELPNEALARPPAKRRRTQTSLIGGDDRRNGFISLEAICEDGQEVCAITALLTDDLLPVRSAGDSEASQSSGHVQMSSDSSKPVFLVLRPKPSFREAAPQDNDRSLWRVKQALALAGLRPEELFSDFVRVAHPAMPILGSHQMSDLAAIPPPLAAVTLAKAVELQDHLYPLRQYVWEIIKSDRISETALREASLTSVAIAVVELAARPSIDTRSDHILLASTIAHAQLLGLHMAAGNWKMPSWEKEVRERLWWSLRIHDAWASFLNSRPSHIQAGNFSVPLPSAPAYLPQHEANAYASFCYNGRLANIVAKLQSNVAVLERMVEASRNGKIRLCETIEGELKILYDEVMPLLQLDNNLPGMDNFLLLLLGFSCMVHRIGIELRIGLGTAFIPGRQSLLLFERFVDFVASIQPLKYNVFWLPYAEHVLSSVLSSLIRLCLASIGSGSGRITTNDASIHAIALTARLCRAIRPSSPEASFEVGKPARQRAQNVAARLQAISSASEDDEFRDLLEALEGHLQTPAADIGVPSIQLPSLAEPTSQPAMHIPEMNGQQTLVPSQEISELFWDPNLAFSNLDAWLSALDSDVNGADSAFSAWEQKS